MGIIGWIVLGALAGLVAGLVIPSDDSIGPMAATVIGIIGALIGGFVAVLLGFGGLGTFFDLDTWVIAVAGAFILLALARLAGGAHRGHYNPLSDYAD